MRKLFVIVGLILLQTATKGQSNQKVFETEFPIQVGQPAIAANPRSPENILITFNPGHLAITSDGGKTWSVQSPGDDHRTSGSSLLCSRKGLFSLVQVRRTDGGPSLVASSSSDGKTWTPAATIASLGASSAFVNPALRIDSKGNLWASWTDSSPHEGDSSCTGRVLLSSSSNGRKWSPPLEISRNTGQCAGYNKPFGALPAISDDKKLYVAWATGSTISLDRSLDGGGFWLSNDIIASQRVHGWNRQLDGDPCNSAPSLVIDRTKSDRNGLLFLAWADHRDEPSDPDIWFTRSNNYGDMWTTAQRVNNDTGKKAQFMPAMTIDDATGYIYIVYFDRRDYDDSRTDVYLAFSKDSGTTFKNVRLSTSPFLPNKGLFDSPQTAITVLGGTVLCSWVRSDEQKTAVMFTKIRQEELDQL